MSGKRTAASSARRSTPGPQAVRLSASWHLGQSFGRPSTWPQWWQTRAARKRCSTSHAAQLGHSKRCPQARHSVSGRVAAPVEEEERLLAPAPRLFDAGDRFRRQPSPARRALAPQVDGRNIGQRRSAEAGGQPKPAITTRLRIEAGLQRGRCGRQHDRRFFEPRAHDRHVARVVDDAVLLFVGALVLLVDDDEAEVRERQKQRRARADDDARLSACRRRPGSFTLALGQPGMPFGRPGAETRGKPVEKLRGQRDFRQQHESLAPLPQDFGDGLEINLRLARSRHAFEQGRRERAISDALSEIVGRGALIGVEARQAEIRVKRRRARFRGQRDGGERAIRDEALDHARRAPGERGERRFGRWRVAVGERRQDARPRIGHAGRRLACGDEAEFRRRRRGDLARADRHAQQHAARRQRPARHPIDKIAQRGPERRPVEDGGDGFEIVAAAETHGPDDPGRLPRSEGHAHEGSRLELQAGRRAIAVGGVDRDRRQHVDHDVELRIAEVRSRQRCHHVWRETKKPAGAPPASLVRVDRPVTGSGGSRRNRARSSTACNRRDRRWRSSPRRKTSARDRRPCASRRKTADWPTGRMRTNNRSFPPRWREGRAPSGRQSALSWVFPLQPEFACKGAGGLIPCSPCSAPWRRRRSPCARRCAPTCRGGRAGNRAWRV